MLAQDHIKKTDYHNDIDFNKIIDNMHAIAILYVKNTNVIHEEYHNCTDKTLFNIGSIAKFFIGKTIEYLENQKKIQLNTHVSNILKDFPYDNTTIRDLLYHESGIINYYRLISDEEHHTITNHQALEKIYKTKQSFKPGTHFEYSNSNYIILYEIIKKITNEDYIKTLNKVLDNSNKDLKEYCSHEHNFVNMIPSYTNNQIDTNDTLTLGDGGIIASIDFFKDYFKNTVFTEFKPHKSKLDNDFTEHYEYGYTYNKESQLLFHTGSYMGYRSIIAVQPKTDKKIIVLSNDNHCSEALRIKIVNHFIDKE